jgi:Zn-dependent peptidase ImmA (M78 family)
MDKPSTKEVYAAIARRLNISISSLRRVASEYGIVRRTRLGSSVPESIERAREEETR